MRTNEYLELLNEAQGKVQDVIDPRDWQRYIDQLSEIERAKVLRDAEIERKRNEMKDYNPLAWANSPAQIARAKMGGYFDNKEYLPHDDIEGVTVEEFNQREPSNERNKDLYDALVNKNVDNNISERERLDNEIEELEAQLYSMKNQPGYKAARFDYTVKGDRSGLDKIAQNVINSYENALNRKNQMAIAGKTKQNATSRDIAGLVKQYNDLVIQGSSLTDDQSKRMNDNAKNYILTQLRATPEGIKTAEDLVKGNEDDNKSQANVNDIMSDANVIDDNEIEQRLAVKFDKNNSIEELTAIRDKVQEISDMAIDKSTKDTETKTRGYRTKANNTVAQIDKLIADKKKGAANKVKTNKTINDIKNRKVEELKNAPHDAAKDMIVKEANEELVKAGIKGSFIKSVDGKELIYQGK